MRWRIRDPPEAATVLARRIRDMIDLCRPFTLWPPFIGGLLFGLMGLAVAPDATLDRTTGFQIFYAAITLVLINAGSNSINQAADAWSDGINKPYRPIPRGSVTKEEALSVGFILWFIGLTRGFLTGITFGLLVVTLATLAYLYSYGIRLKKIYILNNLTLAITRGILGPLAAWSVFADPTDPVIWAVCTVLMVYTFGANTFKDLPDIEGDEGDGIRNFATVLGPAAAVSVAVVFMVASHFTLTAWVVAGVLPTTAWWYHVFLLGAIYIGWSAWSEKDPESIIENRRSWVLMYIQMMLTMVFFFVVIVYG